MFSTVYHELVRVCPSSAPVFDAENEKLPPSLLSQAFANHLLELYRAGHVEEFPSLAIQIERFYTLGNKKARDWATLGLLESIQSVWSATEIDPERFRRYLQPHSLQDWDRLRLVKITGTY